MWYNGHKELKKAGAVTEIYMTKGIKRYAQQGETDMLAVPEDQRTVPVRKRSTVTMYVVIMKKQ